MKRPLTLLLIMIVVAVAAYITKPSDARCISEASKQYQDKVITNMEATMPATINKTLFSATLKKAFEQSLMVQDNFLYKAILQQKGIAKNKIGWGAFGFVNVEVK